MMFFVYNCITSIHNCLLFYWSIHFALAIYLSTWNPYLCARLLIHFLKFLNVPLPLPTLPPLRLLSLIINDSQLPKPPLLAKLGAVCSHHHPISVPSKSRPQNREEILPFLNFALRYQMLIWKLPNIIFFDNFSTFP